MLRHLSIRDFAIIDELELDFAEGFTVLSGETGAGKSILIDALGLLLGGRADGSVVRSGRARAELTAEFTVGDNSAIGDLLKLKSLDDPDAHLQCVIRRVIQSDGRSRVFVNGRASTVAALREIGSHLIDIHGQHEHQRLSQPESQRELLDEFGGHHEEAQAVRSAASQYAAIEQTMQETRNGSGRDPAQIDYLRFQLKELESLGLELGEVERLDGDHRQLASAGRLIEDGSRAREALYGGEDSVNDRLAAVAQMLSKLGAAHPAFAEAEQSVGAALTQVREAADRLRRALDHIEVDPARLAEMEKRLSAIHDVARKHRVKPETLPMKAASLRDEIESIERSAGNVEELQKQLEAMAKLYREASKKLTASRRKAAQYLGLRVTALMRELGMPQATFIAAVETQERPSPRQVGEDDVTFNFSANPGQPPRPIAKIASGGELSRLSLAAQVTATQRSAPGTMIFDEVDAGIGGGVAEIVGAKLRELAGDRQVLCVTHLPQVAAQGEHHFSVKKEVKDGHTRTLVEVLDAPARQDEMARMLGGVDITAQTRAHAREMLQRAPGTGKRGKRS